MSRRLRTVHHQNHALLIQGQCRALVLPAPELEYRFHPIRMWRFDFAWPDRKIALEVDGGAFINGRHVRGSGVRNDCEKFSNAAIHGWRVLRVLPEHVKSGVAINWLAEALGQSDVSASAGGA